MTLPSVLRAAKAYKLEKIWLTPEDKLGLIALLGFPP